MRQIVSAKKSLGQHFLRDQSVIHRIVALCDLHADEQCVEIGPGQGILTRALAKTGATLIAIEFDRDLVPKLQKEFKSAALVQIVQGDFLEFEPKAHGIRVPYVLAGNIPYNLTSPILDWMVTHQTELRRVVLMMQREVARRVTAVPRTHDWGPLALFIQMAFRARSAFDISPAAFEPMPKVWSSVVAFEPNTDRPVIPHPKIFERVVRGAFAQRRKLLSNNLVAALSVPADRVHALLVELGLPAKIRAEELDTAGFLTLTERLIADRLILPSTKKD